MRSNRSHTGNKRSHHALIERGFSVCPDCKAPMLSHTVCLNCGKYQGRQVLNLKAKLEKKERKLKERNKAMVAEGKK